MDFKQTPDSVKGEELASRWMKWIAFTLGDEVFKWLAWSAAIAALIVAENRLELPWLFLLIVPLVGLLLVRIQSFINIQHPQQKHADGSKTITFTWRRIALGVVVSVFAWLFAWGLSDAIARSDLLPSELAQPQVIAPKATLRATPQTAAPAAPAAKASTPPAPKAPTLPAAKAPATLDATAFAAWGTWAAVVVALGVALASSVSRIKQRRLDARLLATMLFHEVSHSHTILETVQEKVMPGDDGGIVEALICMEPSLREEIAFHIDRIQLPALQSSVNRLSVLPTRAAIAVGELQSNVAFLAQAGHALATGVEPPSAFFPEFRANISACIASSSEARALLRTLAFPDGRPSAAA